MNIIDPDQSVSRIVEQLKHEAARRKRRLSALALTSGKAAAEPTKTSEQVLSPEFEIPPLELHTSLKHQNESHYTLLDLLGYDDREFVCHAYRAILKRLPDAEGLERALDGLRRARTDKIDVLAALSFSEEGREKGVSVSGLRLRATVRRICRLPLIRFLAQPLYHLFRLPAITRDYQRSTSAILTGQEKVVNYVNHVIAEEINSSARVLRKIWGSLEDQNQVLEVMRERIAELTKYVEDRLNEETLQRGRQFNDRTAEIEDLRRVYNKYRTQVELTEKDLKREMEHVFRKQQEVKTELVLQSRRLEGLVATGSTPVRDSTASRTPTEIGGELDAFFAAFDEHFRGDRDVIKSRFRAYLPIIREHGAGTDTTPILDAACGRGEWLELLKTENLRASGVDANSVLVEQCRERGLEVVCEDLMEHLGSVPDSSLGAVTAFHIVEHLPIETLVAFLDETVRVLRSGGLVVIETPNPHNVLVGSCNFYFDPTHRNPLPIPVLKFLVESRGFIIAQTIEFNPSDEKPVPGESEIVRRFNQYFYGPMDYAVVARKVDV